MQNILIAALAAFFIVNFVKACFPVKWSSSTKMLLVVMASSGMLVALGEWTLPTWTYFAWIFAAAGLAGLFHKAHRLFSAYGDGKIREIMFSSLATRRSGR